MTAATKIAKQVIARLREYTNPERLEFTKNYFPSAMENLGVSVPDLRRVVREMKKRLNGEDVAQVLAVGKALIAQNTLEGRQVAYEIVGAHAPTLRSLRIKHLQELGHGMDNWVSVDSFACGLSGQAWRESQITDAAVHRWARARDPWWRRAAVVSTVPLNMKSRGGSGDPERTLVVCSMLTEDPDPMVIKALSWALRSLAPVDARATHAVRVFLDQHEDVLPALVLREVRNKLGSGLKNPGRRKKP